VGESVNKLPDDQFRYAGRSQFTTNQATFALPDAGVLFKLIVALPVEVFGTALTTQTPATMFCMTASTSVVAARPPGTVTVADRAGCAIETTPERLNKALPATLSAAPLAEMAWTPICPPEASSPMPLVEAANTPLPPALVDSLCAKTPLLNWLSVLPST
jgi:hypothetical protein